MALSYPGKDKARKTIKELVEDLLVAEADMEQYSQDHRRAVEIVQQAQQGLATAAERLTNGGRRRNEILKELSEYQMTEYKGDDK